MDKVNLLDICNPKQWKTLATSELIADGKYDVYGANGIIGKYDDYNHEKSTVLITCRGATCGNVHLSKPFSYINGNAMSLDNLDESRCLKEYLYYYLKGIDLSNSISGSAQPQITIQGLKKINVSLYDIKQQRQIVNILSKIENLITYKKDEIEKANQLIKSQFVEMFENKDFPYVKFKEYMDRCVDVGSNGANATVMKHYNMTDEKDYAIVIRFINLNSGDFEKDIKYINKEDYEFYSKSKVYGNEIIFCKIGSAGMNYIMPKLSMPVTLGLNQIMITPKNINTRYLYEYINSLEGKMYINNNINGAVTKTITKHALWEFPIKTPPIELQNKFANIVEQIDKQKFEFEKSLKKLEELQASLMQEYFG